MKYLKLILPAIFIVSVASAQTVKKTPAVKTPVAAKANPKLNVPFLKQTFLLDPAIFFETSIANNTNGIMQLNIKLQAIKTATISVKDFSATSMEEIREIYENAYGKYLFTPDKTGYRYTSSFDSKTYPVFREESITPLEYKAIYHGTYTEQQLAKALDNMPSVRKMEGDKVVEEKKKGNEYDTDENNRVIRLYMLPYTKSSDKGFMLLFYEANYGEDKKNNGSKILQTLLNGISPMKVNEYIPFAKVKETKFLFDFALPADATGSEGSYLYTKPVNGRVSIKGIPDATTGYSSVLEKYDVSYGTVTDKSSIEQYKLANGISIFKQVFTMEKKDDDYTSIWYQVVSVLVPDKKVIKKPLLFTLTSFSSDKGEINSINNFILNSISPTGTLTKAGIDKIKDTK